MKNHFTYDSKMKYKLVLGRIDPALFYNRFRQRIVTNMFKYIGKN